MQPYPRSPDLVWPGHLHGTGCLSARAVGTGFPTVVRRLCLGPVGGWVWVLLTSPVLAGVLGGCVWHGLWRRPSSVGCLWCSWLGFGFGLLLRRVWFRGRPACPLPFPVPACGVGVCVGPGSRLCPALLGWVVGVCFLCFCFFFCSFFRALWSLSLHLLSFGLGWWLSLFFIFSVSLPLFPVGRCYWLGVAPSGWVVPLCLCAGPVFVAFWGGFWPPVGVLTGGLAAVGCFRAFSPSPLPSFFFWGGGACLFLPLHPLGCARTGLHSVLSSGLLSSVAFCVAAFRPHGSGGLYTRWARRPFLPGLVLALPAGRLRQADACGFGLGGWGCLCPFPSAVPAVVFWVVRHRCRLARCGPVCGLWCWCVACWRGAFQGVRWLASVSPSG